MSLPYPKLTRQRAALCAALIFGTVSTFGACAPDIPRDPEPPSRVSPIYDPVTAVLPLPNSAAIDPSDGTIIDLSTIDEENAAGEFARWLTQLHGWSLETPISIPFDGKLDPETLTAQTVRLYAISEQGELSEIESTPVYVETATGSSVVIVPSVAPQANSSYGAIITLGVQDPQGTGIAPAGASFVAFNDGPIVDESGNILLPELRDDPDRARSLEGLRQTLTPLINGIKADDTIDAKDVAVAFTWSTIKDPMVIVDPGAGIVPLPNTAALDEDGTFPDAGLAALSVYQKQLEDFKNEVLDEDGERIPKPDVTAQVYFDQYLASLHGWPNSKAVLPVELPLYNEIDEDSLTEDAVQVWTVTESGPERITGVTLSYVEPDGGAPAKVRVTLPEDLVLNTNYFAFATRELKDKNGLELQPSAPLYMAMQPYDVVDEEGKSLVSNIGDANARAITGLRRTIQPYIPAIEAAGKNYKELAGVWSWYTWKDPFAVFQPAGPNADIPFPNAFLVGPDGKTSGLPQGSSPLQEGVLSDLRTRDGFSVLGSAWVSVTGDIDPSTLTLYEDQMGSAGIATVQGVSVNTLDSDAVTLRYEEYEDGFNKIYFDYPQALGRNTLHVGILSNQIKSTEGFGLKPDAPFVFVSSPVPLIDEDNKSLVSQIDDTTAQQLEVARKAYDDNRLFVGVKLATRFDREEVAVAFAFTTDDPTEDLRRARARVVEVVGDDVNVELSEDSIESIDPGAAFNGPAFGNGVVTDYSNVAEIQWTAELSSVGIYDGNGNEVDFDDMEDSLAVPFTVFVPKEVPGVCARPFKVALVTHGITGWRVDAGRTLANELAGRCIATVAMDMPVHGGRAPSATTLHPTTKPADSGNGFIGLNLVQTRVNFAQAAIDHSLLALAVRQGQLDDLVSSGAGTFDRGPLALAGISLGAAVGQLVSTIDPNINVTALNVPPGRLSYYLTQPSDIGAGLVAALGMFGLVPGTFGYEQLAVFAQWLGDLVDPQAFARYTTRRTVKVLAYDASEADEDARYIDVLDDADQAVRVPAAQVLVQMALGDMTTPNKGTIELANQLGVSLDDTTFDARHGFIFDGDTDEAQCARQQIGQWLESGLSGVATLPDELKSGACLQ